MTTHLTDHHRHTLAKFAERPTSHNIEWPQVRSLLSAIGEVEEERNGKVAVHIGDQSLVIAPPRHKDIDEGLVVALRRGLQAAGYLEKHR